MRKRSSRAAALLAAAALFSPLSAPAFAETPSPTPTPTITRTPLEQFKYEKELYQIALKSYNLAVQKINQSFKAAIDKANAEYRSSTDKFSAKTLLRSATAIAIAARDAAILDLGAKPLPPIEPPKAVPLKSGKSTIRQRR